MNFYNGPGVAHLKEKPFATDIIDQLLTYYALKALEFPPPVILTPQDACKSSVHSGLYRSSYRHMHAHTHAHTHTHTYTHTHSLQTCAHAFVTGIYTSTQIHVNTHTFIHRDISIHLISIVYIFTMCL